VSELLVDKDVSFLRRAFQHRLDAIPNHEVREALKHTVELSGRVIDEEALTLAVEAASGFAFLIQLVGYHLWRQHPDRHQITVDDARDGIAFARADMATMIFDTTLKELTLNDRAFLQAMLPDTGSSRIQDIAERLGVTTNTANQRRARLIARGVISPRERGAVGFDIPMLRDYLTKGLENRYIV
ncbi:MAG: ATP-binding protein, partial [Propionibacteriaceae bacterium]|jgi:hypothetical protein|nr:ATP-binding protein [Propionibacteriaceae bacterium]